MGIPRKVTLLKDILKSGRLPECIKCGKKHHEPVRWYATYPVCSEECWLALKAQNRAMAKERKQQEAQERWENDQIFEYRKQFEPGFWDESLVCPEEDHSKLFG